MELACDFCIQGTGLFESYLSYLLSSKGFKVIQISESSQYGDENSSRPLISLDKSLSEEPKNFPLKIINENKTIISLCNEDESNKISVDLRPLILFSKSYLVDVLISSKSAEYLNFKSDIIRTYARNEAQNSLSFSIIPKNREEIFASNEYNLADVRKLSKVFNLAKNHQVPNVENERFCDFLQKSPYLLSESQISVVINLLDIEDEEISTAIALKRLSSYFQSYGVFGNYAHLIPCYGALSEIIQAICRRAALHGVTQILHARNIRDNADKNFLDVQLLAGDANCNKINIKCKTFCRKRWKEIKFSTQKVFFRRIMLLKKDLQEIYKMFHLPEYRYDSNLSLLIINFVNKVLKDTIENVRVYVYGSQTQMCPSGYSILYFSVSSKRDNEKNAFHAIAEAEKYIQYEPDELMVRYDYVDTMALPIFQSKMISDGIATYFDTILQSNEFDDQLLLAEHLFEKLSKSI